MQPLFLNLLTSIYVCENMQKYLLCSTKDKLTQVFWLVHFDFVPLTRAEFFTCTSLVFPAFTIIQSGAREAH